MSLLNMKIIKCINNGICPDKLIRQSVFCATLLFSFGSQADSYLGVALGQSENVYIEPATTMELSGGLRLLENFSIEMSYLDLGEYSEPGRGLSSIDGLHFALVGHLPLSQKTELYAKLGYFDWQKEYNENGFITEESGEDMTYSMGVGLDLIEGFRTNLEYRTFAIEGVEEPSMFSVGVSFSF